MPHRWSPSNRVRILPANRIQSDSREEHDGREEHRSHGSARVMTVPANHLKREGHSAGDGPAWADHSPVSGLGRNPGSARPALTPCGGVTPVDGHDVRTATPATNGVLGGTLPRGGDGPPCPGSREHRHLATVARAATRGAYRPSTGLSTGSSRTAHQPQCAWNASLAAKPKSTLAMRAA
jgi:hypothetical protein